MGCGSARVEHFIGDQKYIGCPEHLLTEEHLMLIAEYRRWQRFGLPSPGFYDEMPAHLIDVLEALDIASNDIDRRKMPRIEDGDD